MGDGKDADYDMVLRLDQLSRERIAEITNRYNLEYLPNNDKIDTLDRDGKKKNI